MAAATGNTDGSARRSRAAASALLTVALLLGAGQAFRSVGSGDGNAGDGDARGYRGFLDRSGEPAVFVEVNGKAGPMTATVAATGIRGAILGLTQEQAQNLLDVVGGLSDESGLQVERSYITEVRPDGSVLATTVLALLTPDDYATGVITGSLGTTLTYSPARIELPGDAAPGVTWSSEGMTNGDSPFTLRGAITAAEPRDGRRCIRVETVFEQRNPRTRSYSRTSRSAWCEGRGAVESQDLASGRLFRRATPGSVEYDPVRPPDPEPLPVGVTLPGPFPNADVTQQPVVMGGLVISTMDAAGDLRAVHPTAAGQQVVWVQHPGGEVLGMSADETLLYITTAQRLLLALDAAGRLHWLARLPDAANGAPQRMGDVVAVSLLNGTTHAFDRRDGGAIWSARLSDTIKAPPVASGGLIVSADVSGLVKATRADGTTAWSASVGSVRTPMTPLPDGGVLVADSDDSLYAFDTTGMLRWTAELGEPVTGAGAVLDEVVALPVATGVIGLRLGDGTPVWRLDTPPRPVVDSAGRLASGGIAGRLTPDGGLARRVDLPGDGAATPHRTWPVTVGGQHLVMDASGALTATGDG